MPGSPIENAMADAPVKIKHPGLKTFGILSEGAAVEDIRPILTNPDPFGIPKAARIMEKTLILQAEKRQKREKQRGIAIERPDETDLHKVNIETSAGGIVFHRMNFLSRCISETTRKKS